MSSSEKTLVAMFNSPPVQKLPTLFQSELQSPWLINLGQKISRNPNLMGNSAASDNGVLFEAGSSQNPKLAVYPDADLSGFLQGEFSFEDLLFAGLESPSNEFSLPGYEKAFQELRTETEKDPRKYFIAITKTGKAMRAKSIGVLELVGSIPTDPIEKQAYCRGLVYGADFYDPGKHALKLCITGDGADSLLGLQSSDQLADTHVGYFQAIKQLLSSAMDQSLTDFVGQVRADCAKKHGEVAAAEFQKMVENCPREVLASFSSVELWHMLTFEDKVKEDFAKLPLWKRPEIIDSPPAASIIYPIPGLDWKPSSSTTSDQGGVKFSRLPDLNKIYVEDEAEEGTIDFAIEEEKKASAKKRKTEAASGEGQDHVPKMPTVPSSSYTLN